MKTEVRTYPKPSMTNLPADLWKIIYNDIMNAKAPDREAMKKKSEEISREIGIQLDRYKREHPNEFSEEV